MSNRSFLPLLTLLLASPTVAQSLPEIDLVADGYPAAPTLGTDTVADCNDTDASINPGVRETWYDGIDQDCSATGDYCPIPSMTRMAMASASPRNAPSAATRARPTPAAATQVTRSAPGLRTTGAATVAARRECRR